MDSLCRYPNPEQFRAETPRTPFGRQNWVSGVSVEVSTDDILTEWACTRNTAVFMPRSLCPYTPITSSVVRSRQAGAPGGDGGNSSAALLLSHRTLHYARSSCPELWSNVSEEQAFVWCGGGMNSGFFVLLTCFKVNKQNALVS